MAVNIIPIRIPTIGFWTFARIFINAGWFARGSIEELIIVMPINKTPSPARISPKCLSFSFF